MTLFGDNEPAVGEETSKSSEVWLLLTVEGEEDWSSVITESPSSASSRSMPDRIQQQYNFAFIL